MSLPIKHISFLYTTSDGIRKKGKIALFDDRIDVVSIVAVDGSPLPEPKPKRKRKKSRGLGDTVKNAINKLTGGKVKSCGGCKKRQEALNKMLPYKSKDDSDDNTKKDGE